MMGIRKHKENEYLELPDWKKVGLKIGRSDFSTYPLQTKEQRNNRKYQILRLCAYFQFIKTNAFIRNHRNHNENTLDGVWNPTMEKWITPRSLDIINFPQLISDYAICYACEHYGSYRNSHYMLRTKMKKHRKIVPFNGVCTHEVRYGFIIDPEFRCENWSPFWFYQKIIDNRIKRILNKSEYSIKDYEKDLDCVDLFDYFQDRYRYMDF